MGLGPQRGPENKPAREQCERNARGYREEHSDGWKADTRILPVRC